MHRKSPNQSGSPAKTRKKNLSGEINPFIRKPESTSQFKKARKFRHKPKNSSSPPNVMTVDNLIESCKSVRISLTLAKEDLKQAELTNRASKLEMERYVSSLPLFDFKNNSEYQSGKKNINLLIAKQRCEPQSQTIVKSVLSLSFADIKHEVFVNFQDFKHARTAELLQLNKRTFGGKFNKELKLKNRSVDNFPLASLPAVRERKTNELLTYDARSPESMENSGKISDMYRSKSIFTKYIDSKTTGLNAKRNFANIFHQRLKNFPSQGIEEEPISALSKIRADINYRNDKFS